MLARIAVAVVWGCLLPALAMAADGPIRIMFLGDQGHHRPADRFRQLEPVLKEKGIELTYTERVTDLNADNLNRYHGLLIYANTTQISPEQEKALLEYVESGRGFIPLHCASFCFLNSPKYIDLVGAQFQRHGTGTFKVNVEQPDHEIMKGFEGFESFDETYVHTKHNPKDRIVLETRAERGGKEPWTWVRTQGKGRVFYTAWGHDHRTWGNKGFQDLVERGIRWAVAQAPAPAGGAAEVTFNDRPAMTPKRTDVKPFEYVDARVPFYPPNRRGGNPGPLTKMQKPLDPAESQKHYVMPQGFRMELLAAEPAIGKPLCMNWDERGRLWISETLDYPNELQPEGQGRDRIRICQDTNGDGTFDRFTTFADKLSIATSLVFARGGVIVHQAPHTLFLKDTNGDDVADVKEVLFTGWSTGDTHAGPSNLHYGHDNWIYGIVGYSGFTGTIGGESHSFRQAFYRFKPDGSKLEVLRNTNNNSWGVGLSEEGLLFGSTANGNPSVFMPVPNRYYEGVRGWSAAVLPTIAESNRFEPVTDQVRQVDWHGGFTAAAGHALYTARNYPREYWNRTAFVAEPTGHLVATFVLSADGAGFKSRNAWNLVASDDEWASPIVAEVGPDGNVWMIDWYNFIVQHNPTPAGFRNGRGNAYETELRDKKHGRIYRLVHENGKKSETLSLQGATPEKLIATLKNDNLFWRRHAQRLLVERGKNDVAPALAELVKDQTVDEAGLNVGAIHALFTLDGLKAITADVAIAALKHPSAGVRRAALTVLPREAGLLTAVAPLTRDANGQVRLAAYLALADMPSAETAAAPVVDALQDATLAEDRWLLDAVTAAGAKHDVAVFKALAALGDKVKLGDEASARLAIIAEHYARGGDAARLPELIAALETAAPAVADTVVAGLAQGWPRDKAPTLDKTTEDAIVRLFPKLSPGARANLITLAGRWGNNSLAEHAAKISESFWTKVNDETATDANRAAAASQLVDFQKNDLKTVQTLLDLINARTSPELARGLIDAVAKSEHAEAGNALVSRWGTITPQVRPNALRALLARTQWTFALMYGIEEGKVQLSDLALDQRQALAAHPESNIARRARALLAAGGGLPNADRQKVLDELLPLTKEKGDAVAGKLVFKNQCAKCHTHSGEGTKIGPDLTGMAVHPKHELLIHLIDPSRSVEGNYRVYTLVTADGRTFTGLLASETKTAVELIDAEGKKQAIQREDIEELVASTKSLMPEGFEKQVKTAELRDLLEFLTQRGKFVPIPLDKVATVITTKGMFYSEDAAQERIVLADWSPREVEGVPFSLVDPKAGTLPNGVLLFGGPANALTRRLPRSVTLPCNTPAKAIHLLGGVSGWGHPFSEAGSVSMIVRLHYADGQKEDHELKNGEHFADYIRRVDVPQSKFAFSARGQQLRYLAVLPKRTEAIERIELVKGPDTTAPLVMAVTVETHQP